MCLLAGSSETAGMKRPCPNLHPDSGTDFRIHPGLVLEIFGPGTSTKVKLSPRGALGIAQALIFDAREALYQADLAAGKAL